MLKITIFFSTNVLFTIDVNYIVRYVYNLSFTWQMRTKYCWRIAWRKSNKCAYHCRKEISLQFLRLKIKSNCARKGDIKELIKYICPSCGQKQTRPPTLLISQLPTKIVKRSLTYLLVNCTR